MIFNNTLILGSFCWLLEDHKGNPVKNHKNLDLRLIGHLQTPSEPFDLKDMKHLTSLQHLTLILAFLSCQIDIDFGL